jgi:hypothetical protein|tara:strand:- start:645 stop:989 length:345 start_codon:yes stop_codon:yes gene_type:complete
MEDNFMANPRRRRIKKISARAAEVARAAGNEVALEAALAIASGCNQVVEAEAELSRVESLCAPKPKVVAPVVKPKAAEPVVSPKPKAAEPVVSPKPKAKGLGSKLKKAISKDKE